MTNSDSIARLRAEGWQVKAYTMSSSQTYLQGILFALPFVFLAGGMYRVFLLERAVLLDHTSLIFLGIIIVSLPVHEGLHGMGWKLAGRLEKGEISFFIRQGMPMCTCKAVLDTRAYLTGTLFPFLILGGGSFLFLIAFPGTVSLLTALVNLVLPGADLAIAYKVLRSGAVRIADSPDQAGFIGVFYKGEQKDGAVFKGYKISNEHDIAADRRERKL